MRRKLGHGVAFYKVLTLGAYSIAKKRDLSNQKQPCCTSTIPQALCQVSTESAPKRSRYNVFNVRPFASEIYL